MMIAVSCAVQGPTAIEKRKQAKPRPGHGCCACVHKKQAADKRGGLASSSFYRCQHWQCIQPAAAAAAALASVSAGTFRRRQKKTILFFKKHF